jgi:hypothetical protein
MFEINRKSEPTLKLRRGYNLIAGLDSESLFVYYVHPLLGNENPLRTAVQSPNNPLTQKARAFFVTFTSMAPVT